MKPLNLKDYEKFIKENGYEEEQEAVNVARVIISHHTEGKEYEAELFPRFVLNNNNERFEFDLLIILRHEKKIFNRKIGVEFKETDIRKAISQAVARSQYVDYQYIATKNVWGSYEDIMVMTYFGIGWVVWGDGFSKIIFPARFREGIGIKKIIDFIIEEEIRKEADKVVKETIKKVNEKLSRLDRYIEKEERKWNIKQDV